MFHSSKQIFGRLVVPEEIRAMLIREAQISIAHSAARGPGALGRWLAVLVALGGRGRGRTLCRRCRRGLSACRSTLCIRLGRGGPLDCQRGEGEEEKEGVHST